MTPSHLMIIIVNDAKVFFIDGYSYAIRYVYMHPKASYTEQKTEE